MEPQISNNRLGDYIRMSFLYSSITREGEAFFILCNISILLSILLLSFETIWFLAFLPFSFLFGYYLIKSYNEGNKVYDKYREAYPKEMPTQYKF